MLNRRDFARLALATLAATSVSRGNAAEVGGATQKPAIKPRRLATGDTIGIVLPASAELSADDIAFARDQMTAIGFNVILGAHVYDRWGYLAGHDRDRA